MRKTRFVQVLAALTCLILLFPVVRGQEVPGAGERRLLETFHSISSHALFDYVKELASEKYAGRLTGTEEYRLSAEWAASHFKKWGIRPAGASGTFLQAFPVAYTLVLERGEVTLNIPFKNAVIRKPYRYEEEFIPGSTSASGEVTAEVVYVGFGITASELGYDDDYKGVDVKGKIVLMEREVPVSPDSDPELFMKWRPYSFHQFKLENAADHGAAGMLYNYGPIANPNNSYREGFVYSHVGDAVVADIFAGTGREHAGTVEEIRKTLKPRSFATGKVVTLKNVTEHHPDGTGYNVLGLLEGSDPELRDEVIIIGAHLDHLGLCHELMPGANDNASGVAVVLGVAEAMARCQVKPRRSVLFILFGAEEQGVVGSEFYLENPVFPLKKTVAFINLDSVGVGDRLNALAAKNFPGLWDFIDRANGKYIHRIVSPSYFSNIARPRLDAARFMWKEIPSLSFSSSGGRSYYHITRDSVETITPEIMEDLARLLFMAVIDMAGRDSLDFQPPR